MKKIITTICCTFLLIMNIFLAACGEDDNIIHNEIILEVDAIGGDWYSFTNPEMPRPGMYVRKEGSDTWMIWPQSKITGFSYEEGYYYKLLVDVTEKIGDPTLGGSNVSYKLLKVQEKTPSESIRN